jgi:histidinol-phosphatase
VNPDLAFALELADVADAGSMKYFRKPNLVVETKADGSPVSTGDREVEDALRREIASSRPADVVLGEERGSAVGERRWIIDPIDGTTNYVRGHPLWGTLIAVESDGALQAGVVSAPALTKRWWAARGGGAFADGRPIAVSGVSSLAESRLLYRTKKAFDRAGQRGQFEALALRCGSSRPGYGGFWPHILTAQGNAELVLAVGMPLWDIAAPALILAEAGGRITTVGGASALEATPLLSSNGLVHEEALALLAE